MKFFAAACVSAALLAAGVPARAQTATAPTNEQIDPVKLKLAEQLVEASGGKKQLDATLTQLYAGIGDMMGKALPPEQARLALGVQQMVRDEILKLSPQMLQISERIYARDFSEKELADYLAWLKSDSGQAVVRKQPTIMREAMAEETPMMVALMPTIMHKVVERTCAEMHCSAKDRQVLIALTSQALQHKSS